MFRLHPRQALQPDQNTKHMPGKGRAESDRVIVPSACAASTRLRRICSTRTSATSSSNSLGHPIPSPVRSERSAILPYAAAMAFFDFDIAHPRDLDLGFYLFCGGMKPAGL